MPNQVGVTHHVQLGGRFYLVKPGSYSKRVAPQFGARFTTGDPDYNNLSMWQHWAQKCLVGGMDAEEYADDAMYDEGVGVNTWEHDRVTLARDLRRGTGANWAMTAGLVRKFIVYNNNLYCAEITALNVASKLWRWSPVGDAWVQITSLTNMVIRSIATFDGKLFIGGTSVSGPAKLVWANGVLPAWTTQANPAGITNYPSAMRTFQQRLYVAYGTQVWRMKDDQTWDGSTVFYKADMNSDSNEITAFETHLGFLYFLSRNGHIHRTDGNTTFDIWSWDGGTAGVSIKSFDGRLFVATNEFEDPAIPTSAYGVLYQMSGSAMTQLKRWGKAGEATGLGSLMVYDRHLYYGASNLLGMRRGFGIAQYDPVEDAHSVLASNADTVTYAPGAAPFVNFMVDDVIAFGGRLFASVRGHGVFYTVYSYHDRARILANWDTTGAGFAPGPLNGGWFTTSTYDAGTPGLRKLWRRLVIDYELPDSSTSVHLEYSVNRGVTWGLLGYIGSSNGVIGARSRFEFSLPNAVGLSMKLRVTLRSTNSIYTPSLYGFVVSYIPLVEPTWLWSMTLVLSERQALLDGTTQTLDTAAALAFLNGLYRDRALVAFTDVEGINWSSGGQPGVLIYDITFLIRDLTQPLEAEVQISLLEGLETY